MSNFKMVAQFANGLTKENTILISESMEYKNNLQKIIDERISSIDAQFNYHMNRLSDDGIQLTSWVKGGRL